MNGDMIERKVAYQILKATFDDVVYLNEIADYKCNGIYVEVKSCKMKIRQWRSTRNGRFVLNENQHAFLQHYDGIYLFIIEIENNFHVATFVKARKLKFKRLYNWKEIIKIALE